MSLEYVRTDPETGLLVTKVAAVQYEPVSGHMDLTTIYDEGKQGEPAQRWVREDRLRLLNAEDLRLLAESADLEVEVLAGDYDLNPVSAHDERAILIARGRSRSASRP
jgi:hypothetical protein